MEEIKNVDAFALMQTINIAQSIRIDEEMEGNE